MWAAVRTAGGDVGSCLVLILGFPNLCRDRGLFALTGKRTSKGRLLALGLWIGVLAGGITFTWDPAQARAGEYTVWSCRGPGGLPISAAAWQIHISDATALDMTAADQCASGGPLLLEATPREIIQNRNPTGEAIFQPPAGTLITHFKVWRYAAANDGPSTPLTTDDYASSLREWPVFAGGEGFISECGFEREEPNCAFGDPADPLGEANLVDENTWTQETEPGAGVPPLEKLGFWVGCVRSGCEPAATGPTAVFNLYRAAVTIGDDAAPVVERLEGSMAEPAPVSGVANLTVTALDQGGGVAAFAFSIDGGTAQAVRATGTGSCEAPFYLPQPCPTTATRGISVDTAGLAPGAHTVAGSVADAAGNATPFGPISFTVAAPAGGGTTIVGDQPNNGTPAVTKPRLRLSHAGGPHHKGKAPRLRGTLTTPSGVPIAGARLEVEISELGSKRGGRALSVRTDAHGRFAVKVAGDGAHNVVVSYSPIVGGAVSRTATALVKAPLTLRLVTRARPAAERTVHFHGHLRGAGAAARGATAEIQAIANGHWTTVETVTVDAGGTFVWTHRFRYVERDALFSFRAEIPKTPGWPWATVRSPRIKVAIEAAR